MSQPHVVVKLSIEELMQSQQALTNLGNLRPTSTGAAYWIGKAHKKAMKKIESLGRGLQKTRLQLVMAMGTEQTRPNDVVGEPPVPTGQWTVKAENEATFQEAWRKTMEAEVEVEIVPIALSLLPTGGLSIADCAALGWLLVDDVPKAANE